jgi:nucleotide-binding universal stress UspA family protein
VKDAGIPFTAEVAIGDIAATINKRAEELGCDGIVMGTAGTSAMENLLMGSVATKLVHITKLPVTLVK